MLWLLVSRTLLVGFKTETLRGLGALSGGHTEQGSVARTPDPRQIYTSDDLTSALQKLRRLAAGSAKVTLPLRQIAERAQHPLTSIHRHMRGETLPPRDVFERMLRALGVPQNRMAPWLAAWDRVADAKNSRLAPVAFVPRAPWHDEPGSRRSTVVGQSWTFTYALQHEHAARVCIATGDIQRLRAAEIWVNSENTNMEMPRITDRSVSAVIRYFGSRRDDAGNVVDDLIADELHTAVAGRRPLAPGSVVVTGPGMLAQTNRVRHIIHVAAVYGEPGGGYRQVSNVGHCVTSVLEAAEGLARDDPKLTTIVFPLLGTGEGRGEVLPTVNAMLGAVIDHLSAAPRRVRTVLFMAHTNEELGACRTVLGAHPGLRYIPGP